MTDLNYKKYVLEKLSDWIHDSMSCDDITPQEIYNTIKDVVKESQEYHQKNQRVASELLDLLNGTSQFTLNLSDVGIGNTPNSYHCDKDDSSPECRGAWNDFWEDKIELPKEDKVIKWQLPVEMDGPSGEYYVSFPDDLLDAAGLEEGDTVDWIDNQDGSWILKKVKTELDDTSKLN